MIYLPREGYWTQKNIDDRFGDIWSSFNIDISKKPSSLMVSPRMLLNINTDDDAQLDAPPCAFKAFTVTASDAQGAATMYLWAIAGNYLWNSRGGHNTTFKQDATSSTPTACNSDQSDLCVALSNMFVTQASRDIKYLNTSGTWNTISNALANSSGMHQMTHFRALNRIYTVDDNAAGISSLSSGLTAVNVAASTQYTLNDLVEGSGVNVGSFISCISSNSSRIGIGTINTAGSYSKFYTWDGSTGGSGLYGPNEEYNLDASGVLAQLVVDDVFTIFDTKGRLMQLNGGTFFEIARLPLDGASLKLPLSTATNRPVHYNGMSFNEDGNIEIFINTELWDTNATIKENCPSGVWVYDRKTKNFYHKMSLGISKSGDTITDYGQQKLSLVGALEQVEVINSTPTNGSINGKMLAGARYYTTATTTKDGLFYDDANDTLQKAGYIVSTKLFSSQITDFWQFVTAKFRNLLDSSDKIIVKARSIENNSTEATITYVNTTSFTVLASAFTTAPVVGDEVEILQGVGSGRTMHITAVSGTTTLTITVDETITGATTQTAKARFQTWKKVYSYSSQSDKFFKAPIPQELIGSDILIQLKIWLLFKGKDEVYGIILSSKPHQLVE